MNRRLSIGYVAPGALPALAGAGSGSMGRQVAGGMGGAELQQALVARELARRGHRVTFLVEDSSGEGRGALTREELDGVRVIAWETRDARAPGKGWRHAREAVLLLRAMVRAEADLYIVRSNHLCAAMVGGICGALRKPFVFASGHDGNCDPSIAHRRLHPAVAISYAAALRSAAAVVAQGEAQKESLARHFGVEARVIPSGIPAAGPPPPEAGREGILWVGCIEPRKGPDRALDVATALPGLDFTMVGGPGDDAGCHAEIEARAGALPNVAWLGALPHGRTLELFERAAISLNTSRSEGFPNTFLEAWMRGAPVVSMGIDPDGCLRRHGIGVVEEDPALLPAAILGLVGDPRRRAAMARAARDHVESRHSLDAVADAWEALLQEATFTGAASQAAVGSSTAGAP